MISVIHLPGVVVAPITDHLTGILDQVEKRVAQFKDNDRLTMVERIFSVYGHPGMGKTWLLLSLQDHFCAQGIKTVYLDMNARTGNSPVGFVRHCRAQLPVIIEPTDRLLFLLDNVPAFFDDEQMTAFEDEFLWPSLDKKGDFVIWAQLHPNRVGWRRAIPRLEPMRLPGFTSQGLARFWGEKKCKWDGKAEKILYHAPEYIPGLVEYICRRKRVSTLTAPIFKEYLLDWWKKVEGGIPPMADNYLEVFARLAYFETLSPGSIKDQLEKFPVAGMNTLNLRLKLKDLGWITDEEKWYEPIRTVLCAWLCLHAPFHYGLEEKDGK